MKITVTLPSILLFSPTPDVHFDRIGNVMPSSKYESGKFGSVMKIKDIQEVDEGRYKCIGANSQGRDEYEFEVDVQGELATKRPG